MDPVETHEKIIGVLNEKGPSLPINIAKVLEISSLFISAFLSELTNQKRIQVSSLKVGGSPLYYMRGQEEKLEDYYKYLHPREAEAFLLLREHKVLKDSDQDPATRVALRSIKDFSVGFKMNEDIYWRFVSVPKEEVNAILNGNVVEEKVQEVVEEKIEEKIEKNNSEMVEPVVKEIKIKSESDNKFNNPLVMDKEIRKKEKPKSKVKKYDFVL